MQRVASDRNIVDNCEAMTNDDLRVLCSTHCAREAMRDRCYRRPRPRPPSGGSTIRLLLPPAASIGRIGRGPFANARPWFPAEIQADINNERPLLPASQPARSLMHKKCKQASTFSKCLLIQVFLSCESNQLAQIVG